MTEKQIEKMMKSLDLTRDEAIALIKEDEQVDKMTTKEVNSDLTAEQKKVIKDATKTTSKKRAPSKRERKVDETKKVLLEQIQSMLKTLGIEDVTMKTETELNFPYEHEQYTLKLIKHRAPKAPKQGAFLVLK